MRAEVREMTSLETGVLGLHSGETVLFHLDQVRNARGNFERNIH